MLAGGDWTGENKGKVTFASPGVGTVPHLAGELLKQISGIEMRKSTSIRSPH
jgi:hypothetical protein